VRDFVIETALGAIADGFDAEAVVIARRDGAGQLAVVSSRIPPSWEEATSLTFELFGMLWYWLDHASYAYADPARWLREPGGEPGLLGEAGPLGEGGRHLWIGCQPVAGGHLAAAVVRGTPYSEVEQVALSRLVRSVAAALGGEVSALPPGASVTVSGDGGEPGGADGEDRSVEVCVEVDGRRRRAAASAPSPELAAARAAAGLCDAAYEVTFAGQTELDGSRVTIVLVDDGRGSPFLGLAISDRGDLAGAAEAVFSAVGFSAVGFSAAGPSDLTGQD
jgi:hypothetical protein